MSMYDKKILFMGGRDIGYGCLEFLLKKKYNVVGCFVNADDKEPDRWYKSVTEICFEYNVPVYCNDNINSSGSENLIKKLKPDIIVVVYFHQILKANIITIPEKGCINLHMALSQIHRGCYPTTWALIRGDAYSGVTFHYITEKIDGGPVIAQKKIKIMSDWTSRDLYFALTNTGIQLFKTVFPNLEKQTLYQIDISNSKYYKKEFPSFEVHIPEQIYNYIRALLFEPFPAPYIKIGEKKYFFISEDALNTKDSGKK